MDIFFFEAFEEEEEALKHYLPKHIEAGFTWKTIQEYGAEELPAPIISVRTQSQLPLEWAAPLSAIITRSTGFDHIKKYRQDSGIQVKGGYLPLYCNRAVAEQAMLVWMTLLRKLKVQINNFKSFHRDGITGLETEHKTLLVVGVGNIGSEIVKIGKGLGMNVLCVDIDEKYPEETYISLEEGVKQADIIACSMNLTSENRNMFHYDLFKTGKKGLVFVNVSRGEQSPSVDLLKLLEEGHLGGVGLDVYNHEKELAISLRENTSSENEEVQATLQLSKRDDVVLTPHNAFNTLEAVDRKSEQSIQQLVHFLDKGVFIWDVPSD